MGALLKRISALAEDKRLLLKLLLVAIDVC